MFNTRFKTISKPRIILNAEPNLISEWSKRKLEESYITFHSTPQLKPKLD